MSSSQVRFAVIDRLHGSVVAAEELNTSKSREWIASVVGEQSSGNQKFAVENESPKPMVGRWLCSWGQALRRSSKVRRESFVYA